ncbi:hypothetical protein A2686_00485 [Candidatus Woesebacteria bacterium RIFCSPHIGHO2_01_FULL_38_10]|uniref:Uncharacterized protein n=1 Tax=Candidatus Woesebacteria bacterium RIFCSPLOWO2_01_FULL_39_10b TaxID=1802517 RepID=A0A1F8B4S6_9BACT|nr:MAG: hypothetical protein A2686_00485 [Candidatus Woesebacteria bacterium RIFCSPHIGHO2_01_FULL_38_10]OGM59024.1 MAG: hypothetical protein A2892_05305 [Candidatus Woesebacteria bacterium RIFCSPLOWO2_01_FULL_39_10b]
MLLWAVFTLGYLFGVFVTLAVFLKKDVLESQNEIFNSVNSENFVQTEPWQKFAQLIKINNFKGLRKGKTDYSKRLSEFSQRIFSFPKV